MDDERAVSPVVGFVLIFALIMIVFTLYQSSVVPAQNEEVEFKHSQTVEGEMSRLNDAIQQAGTSGVPQSATVTTGVQYPDRALAINPGSPAGSLSTGDPQTVTVSGLSDGSGYWSTNPTFETRIIGYQPSYNLLQQRTEYTLENGMLIKDFENDNPPTLGSEGGLLSDDGKRINLLLVAGEYQKSGVTTSLTARPVSTSTEYVRVGSDGGEISVPTTLPRDTWTEILGDGFGAGTPNVKLNGYIGGDPGSVKIGLKNGESYALRVAEVTLGSSDEPELKYLKSEDSTTEPTVDVGTPETLTVSAHDEFGTFAAGETVEAKIVSGSGTFAGSGSDTATASTDDGGRATFNYAPGPADAGSTVEIELTLVGGDTGTATLPDGTSKQLNTVTYEFDVPADSDTDPDDIGSDIDNGFALTASTVTVENARTVGNNAVEFVFENSGSVDMKATRVQFNGYVGKFPNGKFATEGRFAGTDVDLNGKAETLSSPFSVSAGSTTSVTLSNLNEKTDNGLLIISVQYEYTDGGETKTDTATYSVTVSK